MAKKAGKMPMHDMGKGMPMMPGKKHPMPPDMPPLGMPRKGMPPKKGK